MALTIELRISSLFFWQCRNQDSESRVWGEGLSQGDSAQGSGHGSGSVFPDGLYQYCSPVPLHRLCGVYSIDQTWVVDSMPLVFASFLWWYRQIWVWMRVLTDWWLWCLCWCWGLFLWGYFAFEGMWGRTGAWLFCVVWGECGSMCRDLMVVWCIWWEGRVESVFGQKLFLWGRWLVMLLLLGFLGKWILRIVLVYCGYCDFFILNFPEIPWRRSHVYSSVLFRHCMGSYDHIF